MARRIPCNMDCFNCIHDDCINDIQMSKQEETYFKERAIIMDAENEMDPKKKAEAVDMIDKQISYYHREKEKKAAYYRNNAETRKAYQRDYQKANREKLAAYKREYRRKQKEKKEENHGKREKQTCDRPAG